MGASETGELGELRELNGGQGNGELGGLRELNGDKETENSED
jgi:hypothetical protein